MHPISTVHYLALSAALLLIGTVGVLTRRNIVIVLMSIELILNAVNINLIAFSHIWGNVRGQVFAIFVIVDAVAEAAVDQKVDPEMLERWIKFLARPPKHYSYLRDWQDMVKCGGTLEQAQFLADYFQNLVLVVAREAAALKEENDIIKAKAGVRKKPRRDSYPNEFETNDQFCPGCDLELKTMPIERTNLYLDVYKADQDSESDTRPDPGLLSLRDWALERHFSAETAEHVAMLRAEIEALKAQARRDAEADRERIKAMTREEAAKVEHAADVEIAAAERTAVLALKSYAAGLAVERAEVLLREQITTASDSIIVSSFVIDLTSNGSAN